MTVSDACNILGLSWSQINALLAARNIPSPRTTGGSRGRPGTLSVQAAECVRAIARERGAVVDESPLVVEVDRTRIEADPDPVEYRLLREEVGEMRARQRRHEEEIVRMSRYLEEADVLLGEMARQLVAIQESPRQEQGRRVWWRRFVPRVREVEAVRRVEFMPTETYYSNRLRRSET